MGNITQQLTNLLGAGLSNDIQNQYNQQMMYAQAQNYYSGGITSTSSAITWNGDQNNWGTITGGYIYQSPTAITFKEEPKVKEAFVVVNSANGAIVFQHEKEAEALKYAKRNINSGVSFTIYKAYKSIAPKIEFVEEDL